MTLKSYRNEAESMTAYSYPSFSIRCRGYRLFCNSFCNSFFQLYCVSIVTIHGSILFQQQLLVYLRVVDYSRGSQTTAGGDYSSGHLIEAIFYIVIV